jgi:hypothetical protein
MNSTAGITRWVVRIAGLMQVALGLLKVADLRWRAAERRLVRGGREGL